MLSKYVREIYKCPSCDENIAGWVLKSDIASCPSCSVLLENNRKSIFSRSFYGSVIIWILLSALVTVLVTLIWGLDPGIVFKPIGMICALIANFVRLYYLRSNMNFKIKVVSRNKS